MKKIFLIIAFVVLGSPIMASFESDLLMGAGSCQSNCSFVTSVNNNDYVVSLDSSGTVSEAVSIDLEDSTLMSSSTGTTQTTPSGNESATLSNTYETTTHIIVIVIVNVYDSAGNLVDIDVQKFKFAKPSPPSPPTEQIK